MIRLAFGSVPKDGGTYTFYRNMRPALLEHGIDMRCVAIGKAQAELWEAAYVDDGCVLLAPNTRNLKKQAQIFTDWCETEQIDSVMGINSEAILSALPHLPQRIRCMARCANSFDHGYRITLSGYERLIAIIAQTPRQFKDLSETYGAEPDKISIIPNGIDPKPFQTCFEKRVSRNERQAINRKGQPLRLGFVGRLEHKQKGILFLPEIIRELDKLDIPFSLRIAGKGRHEAILRAEIAKVVGSKQLEVGSRKHLSPNSRPSTSDSGIQFLGAIPPPEIPDFLAETDIFLFPSQFEGCPNALLEAMMAGCLPIAWKLEGITDFIIEDGVSGAIVALGDCAQFAARIAEFATNHKRLKLLQHTAAQQTRERFRTEIAAKRYAEVIHSAMARPAPEWQPKPWSEFAGDPNFEHSWRDWIPQKLKAKLRSILKSG